MQSIITILRAAHCRSTHHYFAIDALQALQTAQSKRLATILLKYHDDYLEGAKAPDNDFKDFQNHVIHVQQNNWGGAALACHEWLGKAREHLDNGNWKKAAYACGVLSHYFTDPIMPLHTAQSSRETVVHRPLEWSICQSYDEIYNQAKTQGLTCDFALAADPQWIGKAVVAAAAVANRHYDRLIDLYDLKRGVSKPREGLNDEAVEILSELFVLAIHGLSAVLTRLADETVAQLPQMSLTLTSLLASVDMPLAWIVRKISDSKERRAVEAVLREYEKTGSLKRNLPAEISVVEKAMKEQPELRMQFGADVSIDKLMTAVSVNTELNQSQATETEVDERDSSKSTRKLASVKLPQQQPAEATQATADEATEAARVVSTSSESSNSGDAVVDLRPKAVEADTEVRSTSTEPQFVTLAQARLRIHKPESDTEAAESPVASSSDAQRSGSDQAVVGKSNREPALRIAPSTLIPPAEEPTVSVHYGSPLVEAPSIGPKTAKRFESIGIRTIRQLVSTGADEIVQGLATRWITEDLVRDWQDQARLVCEVPALTGYRAQLLVAIGCRTSWQLRTANATVLFTQLTQFCETSEGQQILRSARTPTQDDVVRWIDSAKQFARREVA